MTLLYEEIDGLGIRCTAMQAIDHNLVIDLAWNEDNAIEFQQQTELTECA